jgi:hypothetical protein
MARKLIPFAEFVNSLEKTTIAEFQQDPDTKVSSAGHFDEMRAYLSDHYSGITVPHSFMDEDGQIWDCVPIDQQPALKGTGQRAATPPDMPGYTEGHAGEAKEKTITLQAQLAPDRKDRLGNVMHCPKGTIPIRRVTLEEMSRFETLERFFHKSPFQEGGHPGHGGGKVMELAGTAAAVTHKYAHARQTVNNLGGHSFLSVWQPGIGANQVFSLSQHWYAGGTGTHLQTVECGWQVYPGKYGTSKPCLFIYWTADGYGSTGNYNLDKKAFVQTNPAWTLGGSLSPVSTYNGAQYELEFSWYFSGGNWWLYLKGTSASAAIGYYPKSLFSGGQLATCATSIDYGGETTGTTSWPPMGSGHFPAEGFGKAAFHRNIYYFPTAGGAINASLSAVQNSPSCYKINLLSGGSWNPYFYFGGPGGSGC